MENIRLHVINNTLSFYAIGYFLILKVKTKIGINII